MRLGELNTAMVKHSTHLVADCWDFESQKFPYKYDERSLFQIVPKSYESIEKSQAQKQSSKGSALRMSVSGHPKCANVFSDIDSAQPEMLVMGNGSDIAPFST